LGCSFETFSLKIRLVQETKTAIQCLIWTAAVSEMRAAQLSRSMIQPLALLLLAVECHHAVHDFPLKNEKPPFRAVRFCCCARSESEKSRTIVRYSASSTS
jgi:hypothetical protein